MVAELVSQIYPLRGLARANYAVNFVFLGLMVLIVLEMAGMVVYIVTLPKASLGGQVSFPPALIAFIAALIVTEVLLIFSGYASPPLFCIWLYYAYANLPALGFGKTRFSPGWAVGWLFVPAMNLFRPYQVVAELYCGSTGKSSAAPVKCWWGMSVAMGMIFLAGGFVFALFVAVFSMVKPLGQTSGWSPPDVEAELILFGIGGVILFLVGFILLVLVMLATLWVIRDVTRGQERIVKAVPQPAGGN